MSFAEVAPLPVAEFPPAFVAKAQPAPVFDTFVPAVEVPEAVEPEVLETASATAVVFDVLVPLTDGHELVASSHAVLAEAQPAARALAGSGEWLDLGDALVQRPAVTAILVRPRITRSL